MAFPRLGSRDPVGECKRSSTLGSRAISSKSGCQAAGVEMSSVFHLRLPSPSTERTCLISHSASGLYAGRGRPTARDRVARIFTPTRVQQNLLSCSSAQIAENFTQFTALKLHALHRSAPWLVSSLYVPDVLEAGRVFMNRICSGWDPSVDPFVPDKVARYRELLGGAYIRHREPYEEQCRLVRDGLFPKILVASLSLMRDFG